MAEEYKPKYHWQETWAGERHKDYHGFDGRQSFGRIQLDLTTHNRKGSFGSRNVEPSPISGVHSPSPIFPFS